MDRDLDYYRRRLAEERAAENLAIHPAVSAVHQNLAREYEERIAVLEEHAAHTELHLVRAG
jgi:hypothetical protein